VVRLEETESLEEHFGQIAETWKSGSPEEIESSFRSLPEAVKTVKFLSIGSKPKWAGDYNWDYLPDTILTRRQSLREARKVKKEGSFMEDYLPSVMNSLIRKLRSVPLGELDPGLTAEEKYLLGDLVTANLEDEFASGGPPPLTERQIRNLPKFLT